MLVHLKVLLSTAVVANVKRLANLHVKLHVLSVTKSVKENNNCIDISV